MTDAEKSKTSVKPLDGVRVVEMGSLIAGPFCGQLLGDFGAEVVKIETPEKGDPMREWGRHQKNGHTLWWPIIARNKKSVTLNLREEEGQDIARDLIKTADVVVENFRPGTMERWGMGYEDLSKDNPGLVMVRVSGYGQTGPYRDQAGFGSIGEAMGGIRYINGFPDSPPPRVGLSIGDSLAGHLRERTGSVLPGIAPSNIYPTSEDQYVVIGANADNVFRRFSEAIGKPEWADDEKYATHIARGENQSELDEKIKAWTKQRGTEEILELLQEAGVPSGKIYSAEDMVNDPHFAARENITSPEAPDIGPVPMQNVVPRLTDTPGSIEHTGPALGEHNDEIYGGVLGLDEDARNDLETRGII